MYCILQVAANRLVHISILSLFLVLLLLFCWISNFALCVRKWCQYFHNNLSSMFTLTGFYSIQYHRMNAGIVVVVTFIFVCIFKMSIIYMIENHWKRSANLLLCTSHTHTQHIIAELCNKSWRAGLSNVPGFMWNSPNRVFKFHSYCGREIARVCEAARKNPMAIAIVFSHNNR